jgi:type I restriction-modification system DNA methylase subunit
MEVLKNKRRTYGEHLTSISIFKKFILPEIEKEIYHYRWVDLFCGEGNLILPILELVPEDKRIEFFNKHIFLFDIQKEFVEKSILNALKYGIPKEIAQRNIIQMDTIKNYPTFILESDLPVYPITNPPYLYIGYIVKHKETQNYLEYFQGPNEGYQDLYQLALMNDLRNSIKKMVYIIPSNFLFGFSAANKIREDFLRYYSIKKAFIFEKKIFEYTGTNVIICFFERKNFPKKEKILFEGIKINRETQKKVYILDPKNHYRAGNEFEEFVKYYKAFKPLKVSYYLTIDEVENNQGNNEMMVIDANAFNGKEYEKKFLYVNNNLYKKIKSNILFVRTVDTGSFDGKAGLYLIKEVFGVEGILVSKSRYRTHPIQIFFNPPLSIEDQILLKEYFNLVLEYFREKTDSEFMTTYKYSQSEYTRKYLGLTQAKELIETFPILTLKEKERNEFKNFFDKKDIEGIISFIKSFNRLNELSLWH